MPLKNPSTVQKIMHTNFLSADTKPGSDTAMSLNHYATAWAQMCNKCSIQIHFYAVTVAEYEMTVMG
jgi:hypothetical protein